MFFILLEVLLAINFWHEYKVKKLKIEETIHLEMKICAYTVHCEGVSTDFVNKKESREVNILYKDGDFYSYFKIPTVKKSLMKVVYPRTKYLQRVAELKNKTMHQFLRDSLFAFFVSFLFAIYALRPLHKALKLNEEFVKDILHDFNTPISSMKVNLSLFKREIGDSPKIERLENNIESILSLQENLQIFLKGIPKQSEKFSLKSLLKTRVHYFEVLFPDIDYKISMQNLMLETNKDAFTRILDNLLSNAGKYNTANGVVTISQEGKILSIKDTGKGIKDPSKIFKRYYKEQDRGIGIGLHIVKKLSDELHIPITLKNNIPKGTNILLDISTVIAKA